jgi:2-polyprenyl-3-methyl-5-hydroxy-6-metoxy-1,4-benzoquinol methylase
MADELSSNNAYRDPLISWINFAGKDVLEIGCGAGAFTLEHLKQANSILGIDPDEEAIETLKTEWSNLQLDTRVDFQTGNVIDFLLPEETFDVVVFAKSF